jgi:hypothetical protein
LEDEFAKCKKKHKDEQDRLKLEILRNQRRLNRLEEEALKAKEKKDKEREEFNECQESIRKADENPCHKEAFFLEIHSKSHLNREIPDCEKEETILQKKKDVEAKNEELEKLAQKLDDGKQRKLEAEETLKKDRLQLEKDCDAKIKEIKDKKSAQIKDESAAQKLEGELVAVNAELALLRERKDPGNKDCDEKLKGLEGQISESEKDMKTLQDNVKTELAKKVDVEKRKKKSEDDFEETVKKISEFEVDEDKEGEEESQNVDDEEEEEEEEEIGDKEGGPDILPEKSQIEPKCTDCLEKKEALKNHLNACNEKRDKALSNVAMVHEKPPEKVPTVEDCAQSRRLAQISQQLEDCESGMLFDTEDLAEKNDFITERIQYLKS